MTTINSNLNITGSLNSLSNTVLSYLSSNVQNQINTLTSQITALNSNVANITYANNNLTLVYQNVQCGSLTCSSFYQYNLISNLGNSNIYSLGYKYASPNYGLFICSLTTDDSHTTTTTTKYPGCSFYVYFMPNKSLVNIIFNDYNNFHIDVDNSTLSI